MTPEVSDVLFYSFIAFWALMCIYAGILIAIRTYGDKEYRNYQRDNVRYVLTDSGKRALDEANGTCHTGLTIR